MNDLITSNNIVAISGEIQIDLKGLVSIGVAKMENKIGLKIKELKHKIKKIKDENKILNDELEADAKTFIPVNYTKVAQDIQESFKELSLEGTFEVKTTVDRDFPAYHKKDPAINYKPKANVVIMSFKGYSDSSATVLKTISHPITKHQDGLYQEILKNKELEHSINSNIVELRRRIMDINKLERQMKARVVEAQLLKTEGGREILDSFMNQFDAELDAELKRI